VSEIIVLDCSAEKTPSLTPPRVGKQMTEWMADKCIPFQYDKLKPILCTLTKLHKPRF
jgi:hypothetical protein